METGQVGAEPEEMGEQQPAGEITELGSQITEHRSQTTCHMTQQRCALGIYLCVRIRIHDWADSEKQDRRHLGELRNGAKTKAGPL